MIELLITQQQRELAKTFYPFDVLNGSVTKGKSKIYGAMGEIVAKDYFLCKGLSVDDNATYDYDMIVNGYKIDIKTKRINTLPEPSHNASIPAWNIKQKCNFYLFMNVMMDLSKAFILGYKAKDAFYRQATFNQKGEEDHSGWCYKTDCYNIKVDRLKQFKL